MRLGPNRRPKKVRLVSAGSARFAESTWRPGRHQRPRKDAAGAGLPSVGLMYSEIPASRLSRPFSAVFIRASPPLARAQSIAAPPAGRAILRRPLRAARAMQHAAAVRWRPDPPPAVQSCRFCVRASRSLHKRHCYPREIKAIQPRRCRSREPMDHGSDARLASAIDAMGHRRCGEGGPRLHLH